MRLKTINYALMRLKTINESLRKVDRYYKIGKATLRMRNLKNAHFADTVGGFALPPSI